MKTIIISDKEWVIEHEIELKPGDFWFQPVIGYKLRLKTGSVRYYTIKDENGGIMPPFKNCEHKRKLFPAYMSKLNPTYKERMKALQA